MSLTSASTLVRRARHSGAAPSGSLASLGGALVARRHHRQQLRGFRFGRLWSSYLEQDFHRDACRHRSLRYKYAETLSRRLSWEKPSVAENAKSALKQIAYNYWSPGRRGIQAGERYMNTDASPKTPDNPEGIRPGQNIEDAERAPLEHLLFGNKRAKKNRRAGAGQGAPTSPLEQGITSYTIDPITNRKVPKKSTDNSYTASGRGVEIPIRTFKPYRSQFAPFKAPEVEEEQAPVFYDGPPPEAELKKYGQVQIDAEPWDSKTKTAGEQGKRSDSNYGAPSSSGLLDALKWEHREVSWHQNDIIASASGASAIGLWSSHSHAAEYPDLHKYRPVMENDERIFDKSQTYDYTDLDRYTAVRYREPDGKLPEEEQVQEYRDLDKYGAVRAHEPDGKYKMQPEPPSDPQELNKYGAVRSHEPDGKYKREPEPPTDPQELSKYGAVRFREPDGSYKLEPEIPADPQELSKYGAVRSHEPDGKYKLEPESSAGPQELSKYGAVRSHEPDGKYKEEAPLQKYDDLDKYGAFRSHEPDGRYAAYYAEPFLDPAELAHYSKPVMSHEPDGKYAANYVEPRPDSEELAQYSKPFLSHEPDGKYAASYAEPKPDEVELGKYQAFRSHEPDGKYAASHITTTPDPDDLAGYGPFRSHEPDGKYAAEAASASEAADLGNHEAFSYEDSEAIPPYEETQPSKNAPDLEGYKAVQIDEPHRPQPTLAEEGYTAELGKYQAVRWNEPDGKPTDLKTSSRALFDYDLKSEASLEKTPYRKMVEELMARSATESGVAHELQASGKREIEGIAEPAPEGHKPRSTPTDKGMEVDTALPVQTTKPAEPNLYKILVYDPTMQCIEVAETTSVVPDSSSPLTPAEVLLRMSNPARFFPHFAPLQAQGFEIVSGSGDVLIFRKVREAVPRAQQPEETSSVTTETVTTHTAVNPIDKTGGRLDYTVAASRFASPTGFVNYDLPPPAAAPTERFESGINVRREEPVFSGRKTESGKREHRSLPKRAVVGAAWLAGISYSLGVVGEYFRTGGTDGKGPKGL
ncbi:Serine-threonine rich protein [Madurella fahalii]|uniref:Serine-threonine rich protein n=1 Tax=Madurella fahalii TaxID=1157608 RepID=A0ABQ0GPL4_9PEZI